MQKNPWQNSVSWSRFLLRCFPEKIPKPWLLNRKRNPNPRLRSLLLQSKISSLLFKGISRFLNMKKLLRTLIKVQIPPPSSSKFLIWFGKLKPWFFVSVLSIAPTDEDAIRCKVVALIKDDKIDDALSVIQSSQNLPIDLGFQKVSFRRLVSHQSNYIFSEELHKCFRFTVMLIWFAENECCMLLGGESNGFSFFLWIGVLLIPSKQVRRGFCMFKRSRERFADFAFGSSDSVPSGKRSCLRWCVSETAEVRDRNGRGQSRREFGYSRKSFSSDKSIGGLEDQAN